MIEDTSPAALKAADRAPLLYGRYELLSELGRGTSGVVYKAHDPKLDRLVAMKILRPELVSLEESGVGLKQRFHQEAVAAGRLTHPAIVAVHDVGEAEGRPFIVMEYIEGGTLADLLLGGQPSRWRTRWRSSCRSVPRSTMPIATVSFIRDIKPRNILVGPGVTKVTDFGTARILDASHTQTGTMLGTPAYMSPRWSGAWPPIRAAICSSLGVVLYETLTGVNPLQRRRPRRRCSTASSTSTRRPCGTTTPSCPVLSTESCGAPWPKEPEARYATATDSPMRCVRRRAARSGRGPFGPSARRRGICDGRGSSRAPFASWSARCAWWRSVPERWPACGADRTFRRPPRRRRSSSARWNRRRDRRSQRRRPRRPARPRRRRPAPTTPALRPAAQTVTTPSSRPATPTVSPPPAALSHVAAAPHESRCLSVNAVPFAEVYVDARDRGIHADGLSARAGRGASRPLPDGHTTQPGTTATSHRSAHARCAVAAQLRLQYRAVHRAMKPTRAIGLLGLICLLGGGCAATQELTRELPGVKFVKYTMARADREQRASLDRGLTQLRAFEYDPRSALAASGDMGRRADRRALAPPGRAGRSPPGASPRPMPASARISGARSSARLAQALAEYGRREDESGPSETVLAKAKAAYQSAHFREAVTAFGQALVELEGQSPTPLRLRSLVDARCHLVLANFALGRSERAGEEVRRLAALDGATVSCRRQSPPPVRTLISAVEASEARLGKRSAD